MSDYYLLQTECTSNVQGRVLEAFTGHFTSIEKIQDTNGKTKDEVIENLRGQRLNLRKDEHKLLEIGTKCRVKFINGPEMIVINVHEEVYNCLWFLNNNDIQIANFSKDIIEEIVDKESEVEINQSLECQVIDLYRNNPTFKFLVDSDQKIECIKYLRGQFSLGLKEAKDLYEKTKF